MSSYCDSGLGNDNISYIPNQACMGTQMRAITPINSHGPCVGEGWIPSNDGCRFNNRVKGNYDDDCINYDEYMTRYLPGERCKPRGYPDINNFRGLEGFSEGFDSTCQKSLIRIIFAILIIALIVHFIF